MHTASLKAGLKAVRAGKDYVNNGQRYERAIKHLTKAYDTLLVASPAPADQSITLAKICLWKGIAHNENMNVSNPVTRNDPAIAEYAKGLAHLGCARNDALRMSLYNSMAVAHHHRVGGGVPIDPAPSPQESFRYYRRARAIFRNRVDKADPTLADIMNKVESNSGRSIQRGGFGFQPNLGFQVRNVVVS